jgi:peptidoglycan/LPS O-acetylase OafA/YrhL
MTAIESPVSVTAPYATVDVDVLDSTRINNFDIVRLFGALQVAFVHATEHLQATAFAPVASALGFFPGVPIFFAVSGFLVSLSLERSPSLAQYTLNRSLRIFPALWVCFAFSVLLIVVYGVSIPSVGAFVGWAASQLTVLQFYNPGWLRGFGVGALNGSLWTIPVELQFYAILPLLAVWAARRPKRWGVLLVAAGVLMLLLRALVPAHDTVAAKLLSISLPPYLFYFLVGVTLRYAHNAYPGLFRGRALLWCIAYALWMAVEIWLGVSGATGNLLNIVSIILLSGLAIGIAFTRNTLSSRVLGTTDISYGVYIYHMPIVNALLVSAAVGPVGVLAAIALTVVMASLSWRYVERPAMRLKHTTLKSRQ